MNPALYFVVQADDGIRDGHVTGVQTCALPICFQPRVQQVRVLAVDRIRRRTSRVRMLKAALIGTGFIAREHRSEERRVGKESSVRWLICQKKKKKIIQRFVHLTTSATVDRGYT